MQNVLEAQWKADTQTGENLQFKLCKGGYFSNKEEYGLKVCGKTYQDGTPTPEAPVEIQCVKAGTKIKCDTPILPIEYQQVEYIQSTGTQWIDTGYIPKKSTKLDLDIQFTQNEYTNLANQNNVIARTADASSDVIFSFNFGGETQQARTMFYWLNANQAIVSQEYSNVTNRSNLIFQSGKALFQGITTTLPEKMADNATSLMLLNYYNNNVERPFNRYDVKIYSCKLCENDIIVANLVPCYRKLDGVIGLYDTVTNTFLTNKGTGEFLKGNDYITTFVLNEITVPCDLYDGDIWYPTSGKVLRSSFVFEFSGDNSDASIGTENWRATASFVEGTNVFGIPTDKFYTGASVSNMGDILSTHFKVVKNNGDMVWANYPACVMHYDMWCNLLFIAPAEDFSDLASWKAWLAAQKENGTPVTVYLKLKIPKTEQYEPQPIFAPQGTVNVLQEPIDLTADLTATMLVHK